MTYTQHPDQTLVRMAQEGDTRAFDELVHRYSSKVYRLAYRILQHEEDAAEALQEAFLSAYRGLDRFRSQSTFSTWLYRIATNASLMLYRKRRANHVSLEHARPNGEEGEALELPDWSAQPLEELMSRETREAMAEGLKRLPEDLRLVFVLRDLQEMSNADVAEMLHVSVAAVKSRLHRARLSLRTWLTRHFADRMATTTDGRACA